jgi:choline-sulfatase
MAALFGADRSGYFRMGQFSRIYREGVDLTPAELANSRALYDAEIAYVDREVGRILDRLDRLERAGLAGRTLVVFAADHGEDFYEHHRYIGHGRFLYESALRVPMILAGPGVPEGRVVEGTVRTIDLAPTALRLLGLEPPESFEGRSFAGALGGGEVAPPGKTFSLLEDGSMMVRDGRWKLAVHRQTSTVELYDTADDPGERDDREAADDSVRVALEEELRRWARSFADEASAPRELPKEFEERLRALGYID